MPNNAMHAELAAVPLSIFQLTRANRVIAVVILPTMSYDLNFWRYKNGIKLEHQAVYEQLSDGQRVQGLDDLPIDAMIRRISELFPDWEKLDEVTFEGGDRGSFQLFTTPQFFRVDCYGMGGEDMNKFIDIGNQFGCPLYDPQVGERFDGG